MYKFLKVSLYANLNKEITKFDAFSRQNSSFIFPPKGDAMMQNC